MPRNFRFFSLLLSLLAFELCSNSAYALIPHPDHVVVVILENRGYNNIIGSSAAPYINSLINDNKSAIFTSSYAITHPSQPNYIQLFSGSNQGITDDNVPGTFPFTTPNLGAELIAASQTFAGYSEDLPSTGYNGATSGLYARKHNPWVNWQGSSANGIPSSDNLPYTFFPSNYTLLPSISFVIPNLVDDMHNGTDPVAITNGDTWLQANIDGYIQWAKTHNSLLILTFDEDDNASQQNIPTLFIGQQVLHGTYPQVFNHYSVLRLMEDMFNLPYAGASSTATSIDFCWDLCSQQASITPAGPLSYCAGTSVILTSTNASSYLWSDGETTQSITVDTTGNYSVTISNGTSCTSSSAAVSVTISNYPPNGTMFRETMGVASGTTAIATYEANNSFDNDNFTMSGTGDVRNTTPSSGYPGASGGANVFITNLAAKNFIISGINTTGLSNLVLSFGIYKNRLISTGSDLLVQVSSDGINYTNLTFPALSTGSGTAIWQYRTASGNIPSASNLRIQFLQNDTLTQFRIDDVSLQYMTNSSVISASGVTSFCQGGSVTLTSSFANSYNWSNGATTQSISVSSTGNYYVSGTLSGGCSLSSNTIPVNVTPNITPSVSISSSAGNTICAGTNVTYTATPVNGGSTPSYQWKKNGVNVGTNSNTFSINTLANGNIITCVMTSNATCVSSSSVTSNGITMTVNPNVTPAVSISAANGGSICAGDLVPLTATGSFTGSSPTYQWQVNGINVGINSHTYSDNSFVTGDVITCIMTSNIACSSVSTVTSNSITITINFNVTPSISISSNTGDTVCMGANTVFTATPVFGGGGAGFQWQKNGVNAGTNSITYTDNNLSTNDVISCILTSSLSCASPSTATSNLLTMTVRPSVSTAVSISTNSSTTICPGATVQFTAAPVNGGTTPVYQWLKNGSVVGTNSNSYSDNALISNNIIRCILTSNIACPSPAIDTSNGITITVSSSIIPSVSIGASATTVCQGTGVTFNAVPVNGGSSPGYQWKKNGVNSGTNNSSFSTSGLLNGDVISCTMTSNLSCASPVTVTSNSIPITVNANVTPSVTISSNSPGGICAGDNVVFTATVLNGGATPFFQWKKNGSNTGTNSNIYSDNGLLSADVINCVITSNASCATSPNATSNTISISVHSNVTPAITISTNTGDTICTGTPVTFNAVALNGGTTPSFQWTKNGITAGTDSTGYTDNILADGDVVSCVMTSNATCVTGNPATSNSITISISSSLIPAINGFSPAAANPGTAVIITGTNFSGITSVTFNGVNASFVVNNSGQITAVVPASASTGIISVSNNCGTANSSASFTFIPPTPVLNLKLFIEGYYISGGMMTAVLSSGFCDTITVELHNAVSPFNMIFTSTNILNTNGTATFNFPLAVNGNAYYVVAYNRNSLETWSAMPVAFSSVTNYDFTISSSVAYGNNLKDLGDGNFALYSGDVTRDGRIDSLDYNEIKGNSQLFLSGYMKDDLTGDNIIESSDFSLIENNNVTLLTLHP